jgi:dihydropteroate synthase
MPSLPNAEIAAKSTQFSQHTTLNCRGQLINLETPVVMGILNLTPDSFYDGGRHSSPASSLDRACQMLDEGASLLDLGAVSTRPGASMVPQHEELERLLPLLSALKKRHPDVIVSVDTYRSEVARIAVAEGASIINDVSGGTMDQAMFSTIAELQVPYVMMHIQGTPQTMQRNPEYKDVTGEVVGWLAVRLAELNALGVHDVIVDPGFGFGKTADHNYTLMRELAYFDILRRPLMIGISRKSMVHKVLGITPQESLNGSTALHMYALTKGAAILRVHDVKEAVETVALYQRISG